MCRTRTNRVHLWAAQRPYPASMGNISCYKGRVIPGHIASIMYSTNTACHANAKHNISPGLFLVVGETLLTCLTGTVCRYFFSVLERQNKLLHFLRFTHSLPLFCSLKERPNNVKNGCSGSTDDSELNTTPDGQVLQVLSCPVKAFLSLRNI